MIPNWLVALSLSTAAGLATALGGVLVVAVPAAKVASSERWLGRWQSTTAGFMLGLSLFDLLPEVFRARDELSVSKSAVCFVVGALLFALLERLVPEPSITKTKVARFDATSSARQVSGTEVLSTTGDRTKRAVVEIEEGAARQKLSRTLALRSGLLTAVSLALHNLPEGMAVAASALSGGFRLGLPLAIGIALHNAPEGCAIAAPVYVATQSRTQAVGWALASGLVEPLGVLFLVWFRLNQRVLTGLLAGVAGIMTMLSCVELIPEAMRHCDHQKSSAFLGVFLGMLLMLMTLTLVRWSLGVHL